MTILTKLVFEHFYFGCLTTLFSLKLLIHKKLNNC